jgi:hypothetical protein
MLDLDTFLLMIYVEIDDWYQQVIAPVKPKRGKPPQFQDSEALTVAVLSEWRAGVPWQSERGCLRYLHQYYGDWFPHLPHISAFNERKRHLFGVLVQLQQQLARRWTSLYESADSLVLPAGSLGQRQREKGHWLWESDIGKAPHGYFWGDRWLASVTQVGAISGWLVGTASLNDRWLMEAFVSTRAGQPQLVEPPRRTKDARSQHTPPPTGFIGGFAAVGQLLGEAYLADGNFNGRRWLTHWQECYGATVIARPRYNEKVRWSKALVRWLRQRRQIVETAFAVLERVFAIKHLQAHSRWGQYTRLAAKAAAYNLGMWLNECLQRPRLALETLLC